MTNVVEALGPSEQQMASAIARLTDSGVSIIQVKTRETSRTLVTLRKSILADKRNSYFEFDITNGIRLNFTLENYTDHTLKGDDKGNNVFDALRQPQLQLRDQTSQLNKADPKLCHFIFNVPPSLINGNLAILELLNWYFAVLSGTRAIVIFVTPDESINLPPGVLHTVQAPTPTVEELESWMRSTLGAVADSYQDGIDISDDEYFNLACLGLGMTKEEFDNCVCLAIVDTGNQGVKCLTSEYIYDGIAQGKTEVVKQSDLLELFHPEDMANVGGMIGLKQWVEARRNAFSEEAREFGIESPKGVALVGVPGTGKSLAAKAISSTLNVPLLRLDFGKVFSKYIGESESRMRAALNMVSSMGQLVLMVDEIDKGLGGIGGGGSDSGTSSRVLGAFLTWMQENDSGAFVVVTANRIDGLPPELFRKGRMDQIFSVGLPNDTERREVLEVHLRRRGRSIEDFEEGDINDFVEKSKDFVPAEIEAAVKDGLILAFNDEEATTLEMRHIIAALEATVPMSTSHADQIKRIVEWSDSNAISVSAPMITANSKAPARRSGRRIVGRQ